MRCNGDSSDRKRAGHMSRNACHNCVDTVRGRDDQRALHRFELGEHVATLRGGNEDRRCRGVEMDLVEGREEQVSVHLSEDLIEADLCKLWRKWHGACTKEYRSAVTVVQPLF